MKNILLASLILTAAALAQDVPTLLGEAQRDYQRGDVAGAKMKFEFVIKAEPNNRIATAFLRRIALEEKKNGVSAGAALKLKLDKVILEKIEFRETTFNEAIDFLGKKIAAQTEGKMKVSFVLQLSDEQKKTAVTLSLEKVPATEVVKYLTTLVGVEAVYEPFAVVIKPPTAAAAAVPAK